MKDSICTFADAHICIYLKPDHFKLLMSANQDVKNKSFQAYLYETQT